MEDKGEPWTQDIKVWSCRAKKSQSIILDKSEELKKGLFQAKCSTNELLDHSLLFNNICNSKSHWGFTLISSLYQIP